MVMKGCLGCQPSGWACTGILSLFIHVIYSLNQKQAAFLEFKQQNYMNIYMQVYNLMIKDTVQISLTSTQQNKYCVTWALVLDCCLPPNDRCVIHNRKGIFFIYTGQGIKILIAIFNFLLNRLDTEQTEYSSAKIFVF